MSGQATDVDDGKKRGSLQPKLGRCGAKMFNSVKKWGEMRYCLAFPITGRNRCKVHGGMALRGPAHQRYSGTRVWATHLKPHLLERLTAALNDPELLSMRQELALIDSRLVDLINQVPVDKLTLPQALDKLEHAIRLLGVFDQDEDALEVIEAVKETYRILTEVNRERLVWDALGEQLELRRKITESEQKREMNLQATMTAKQAAAFVIGVQEVLAETIKDEELLKKVGNRLRRKLMEHTGEGMSE